MSGAVRHVERERTIVFGAGALDAADELVAGPFVLLSTPRAAADPVAAALVARAAERIDVGGGRVEDVAAELLPRVRGLGDADAAGGGRPLVAPGGERAGGGRTLVALGGGRVIDVAKALAAARATTAGATPDARAPIVIAIPTTLSAAEMTRMHRQARGVTGAPQVRPAVVLNDPALSASAPLPQLAASSANALAHALVAVATGSSPFATAVARDAVARIAAAWGARRENAGARAADPDRSAAALGALLAGWAVDATGLGLHHVLAQTAVRVAGLGHAQANAALLPVTAAAMRRRAPAAFAGLDTAAASCLNAPMGPHDTTTSVERLAQRLSVIAGVGGLGLDDALLDRAVEAAAARAELTRIPPPPDRDELRALFVAAG